jgi:hypothetical protein
MEYELFDAIGNVAFFLPFSRTINPVGSKYSSGPAVISKQATKAFSTVDVPANRKRRRGGEKQGVPFALMVAFRMEMGDELGHGSVE